MAVSLPEDFLPRDKYQAALLAKERGFAWHLDPAPYRRRIRLVTRDTPEDEDGEQVIYGNTWSREEAECTVKELNRAYYLGLNNKTG
jgi:hypothetical protein